MKILILLCFVILVSGCSDGDIKITQAQSSSSVYDYNNYVVNPNEDVDVNGYWLIFFRQSGSSNDSHRLIEPEIFIDEIVEMALVNKQEDESIEISRWSSNASRGIVYYDDAAVSFDCGRAMMGKCHLIFTGKKMLIGSYTNSLVDVYEFNSTEVHAVKLMDFPDGKLPDNNGLIELDASLFGEVFYDIISSPEYAHENFQVSNDSYISAFSQLHHLATKKSGIEKTEDFTSRNFWFYGDDKIKRIEITDTKVSVPDDTIEYCSYDYTIDGNYFFVDNPYYIYGYSGAHNCKVGTVGLEYLIEDRLVYGIDLIDVLGADYGGGDVFEQYIINANIALESYIVNKPSI
jgi:hypothetical protein